MNDLYNKIVSDRGTLENLLSKIPGFSGYMEQSSRREADRTIRDHVAGLLQAQINRLANIERDIISGSGIGFMEKSKSVKTKLENLRRRIASDTPGYSGFFATHKIGPEELAKAYAFDAAMVEYADQIGAALDELGNAASSGEGIGEALSALDSIVLEANQAYDLRDGVFNGIEEQE
jgi:hypothetical protein